MVRVILHLAFTFVAADEQLGKDTPEPQPVGRPILPDVYELAQGNSVLVNVPSGQPEIPVTPPLFPKFSCSSSSAVFPLSVGVGLLVGPESQEIKKKEQASTAIMAFMIFPVWSFRSGSLGTTRVDFQGDRSGWALLPFLG